MKYSFLFSLGCTFLLTCCNKVAETPKMGDLLAETPSLVGKEDYLPSPFVTAGNRVYMVGHQDGTFPSLGWHIKGEMGGIWNHPIKLMDGFDIDLHFRDGTDRLNKADRFTNYPFANQHTFHLKERGLTIERWQFVPDDVEGLVLQLVITNNSDQLQEFKLIFTGHTDLRPTWLGERNNMIDGPDNGRYHPALGGWIVKDSLNPWYVAFAADRKPGNRGTITNTKEGLGSSHTLAYTLTLAPNAEKYINIAIAGSYKNEDRALQSLQDLQYDWPKRFEAKQQRYQQLAKQTKLSVPDPKIQTTFEWLKYNCDWLVRTVPEIGTGIGAGIPDYPWWFGVDSEYALMGYMAIGQEQPVYKTIRLLDSVSNVVNRGNGRIIHEMSSNGAVFNPGNINETPQFASLIWQIYQWNGDDAFLKRYFPTVRKGLAWLIADNDDDGNGFPEGFGMMEIHGLDSEMIDVASYTQKGFADAAQIARALGDTLSARRYTNKANRLKDQINTQFWSEDFGAYADFIGTDKQALHLLEDALVRADTLDKPWATAELEATRKYIIENPSDTARPFVMHRNWVVNTPMEVGLADSTKALQALETAKRYVNPFGVFVTGIDRDASAGADAGAYKAPPIFNYTGAVMTLPTGVQARAENNYGRPNVALNYLERMVRSFSYALPGSMYEVSPDFGMMVQAWNIYSFAYPIVHQFFGIQPMAAQKEITITPKMPDKWNDASLENIKVGTNEVSVFYTQKDGATILKVTQTDPEWTLHLNLNGQTLSQKGETVVLKYNQN